MVGNVQNARGAAVVGVLAIVFGVATIGAGASVLFGPAAVRASAGATVPFVVWGNFLAGFGYVAAGIGIALGRTWAAALATLIATATILIGVGFGAHVLSGGTFERRTVAALIFRSAVWVAIAAWAWRARTSRAPGLHHS